MPHPNELLVRRFFAEFGEETTALEVFTADAIWIEPGNSPISGRYEGPRAIHALICRVIALSGGTFRILGIDDVLVNDRHGLVLLNVAGENQGKTIVTTDRIILTFRDGRISEFRVVSEDQTEVDEFWAEA